MFPTIQSFKVNARFKYLWLKYVTGVNLNVHCARCLKGMYSEAVDGSGLKTAEPFVMNETDAPFYYLCGVSLPYRWERNFHLAFRYKKGSEIIVNEQGLEVHIKDAERIPIV